MDIIINSHHGATARYASTSQNRSISAGASGSTYFMVPLGNSLNRSVSTRHITPIYTLQISAHLEAIGLLCLHSGFSIKVPQQLIFSKISSLRTTFRVELNGIPEETIHVIVVQTYQQAAGHRRHPSPISALHTPTPK